MISAQYSPNHSEENPWATSMASVILISNRISGGGFVYVSKNKELPRIARRMRMPSKTI